MDKKEFVVIGSGSGGLTTAIGLVKLGFKTTIIEKGYIGGDCTNFGCVPSKALLHRAHEIGIIRRHGLDASQYNALEETRQNREEFRAHESEEWLNSYGIELIRGTAKFVDKRTLSVTQNDGTIITVPFENCVISTGSSPIIPKIPGLDTVDYLTNETVFELQEPPQELVVIGAGPIGIEMADAFNQMGSKVTVINRDSQILPQSETEHALKLQEILAEDGISFKMNAVKISQAGGKISVELKNGETVTGDKLLIATGRKSNINLDLDKAGVSYSPRGINIKRNCTTNVSGIFAIGDCTTEPNFTHMAGYMGRTLVTNLAIKRYLKINFFPFKYDRSAIPAVTFSSPEIAQAGLTTKQAQEKYGEKSVKTFKLDLSAEDRLKTQHHEFGQVNLVTVGPFAKIVGAHIISKRAGEMLPEFQLMIAKGMRIKDLGQFVRAYPTYITRVDHLKLEWIFGLFGK